MFDRELFWLTLLRLRAHVKLTNKWRTSKVSSLNGGNEPIKLLILVPLIYLGDLCEVHIISQLSASNNQS